MSSERRHVSDAVEHYGTPDTHGTIPGTVEGVNIGAGLVKIAAGWLFVLMVAIAAAIITITMVNDSHFAAQKTVQSYLQALREGNGQRALGLLNARVPGADAAVLDGAGLAKSQDGLSDFNYAESTSPEGQTKVSLAYKSKGADLHTDFLLTPGPKKWLFFDSWTMVPTTLPVINVSVVNANQAEVNGVAVNMPGGKNSFATFYPGTYSASYNSALFQAPAQERTVSSPTSGVQAVSLATQASSALLDKINSTLRTYLDSCAKQTVLMPAGCPLSASNNNRVISPIKWSIVDYPKANVSPFGGRWVLAPLTVKAQVDYQVQDLFTGQNSEVKTADDFGFTARLTISGNSATVTPVVSY